MLKLFILGGRIIESKPLCKKFVAKRDAWAYMQPGEYFRDGTVHVVQIIFLF